MTASNRSPRWASSAAATTDRSSSGAPATATRRCWHDLAELDSSAPLNGPVLVAVVDGHVWAAIGLDDRRVVADPFLPSGAAVELLRLRVEQLRAATPRAARGGLPRWIAGRVRA